MGAAERRNKDKMMAADLKSRGIPHGKRPFAGLSNLPSMSDIGSAAYRRIRRKN